MKALYDELRKYIFFFQLFALCPFGRNDFQSYIVGLYSLFHFVILVVLTVVAMFYSKVINDNNSISGMVAGLVFLAEIATHVIIILQAFVSRIDLRALLTELADIDEIFHVKLHSPVDYQSLKRKYLFKFTAILLVSKGLLVSLLIFLAFNPRTAASYFWFHLSYSIAVVNMRCIQNIFFVDLLRERLDFVNERLSEISQRTSKKSKLILYVEPYDHGNRSKKQSPMHEEFSEVLALKQIYGMIWNASILLNNCFGWSVLAIVTRSFIGFTSHGYWLFLGFEDLIESEIMVHSAVIFLLIALLLSVMCSSCYNCTGCVSYRNDRNARVCFTLLSNFQAEDTGGLLNKIEKRDNNESLNFLVREFSLQILHEPIVLSANGFFTVNLDLLGSVC